MISPKLLVFLPCYPLASQVLYSPHFLLYLSPFSTCCLPLLNHQVKRSLYKTHRDAIVFTSDLFLRLFPSLPPLSLHELAILVHESFYDSPGTALVRWESHIRRGFPQAPKCRAALEISCIWLIFSYLKWNPKMSKLMGITLKAFSYEDWTRFLSKKLNLLFTGRLFKSLAGRADFTINKYHTCVHMQLPIIVSIPVKSVEFCVCKGTGKFHNTFLMAAATKYNSFPTHLEYLMWHFSLRSCNMQTELGNSTELLKGAACHKTQEQLYFQK